jgi:hypothetical protein
MGEGCGVERADVAAVERHITNSNVVWVYQTMLEGREGNNEWHLLSPRHLLGSPVCKEMSGGVRGDNYRTSR